MLTILIILTLLKIYEEQLVKTHQPRAETQYASLCYCLSDQLILVCPYTWIGNSVKHRTLALVTSFRTHSAWSLHIFRSYVCFCYLHNTSNRYGNTKQCLLLVVVLKVHFEIHSLILHIFLQESWDFYINRSLLGT